MKFYQITESIISDKKNLYDKSPSDIAKFFVESSGRKLDVAKSRLTFWRNRLRTRDKNPEIEKKYRDALNIINRMAGRSLRSKGHTDNDLIRKTTDDRKYLMAISELKKEAKRSGKYVSDKEAGNIISAVCEFTRTDYADIRKYQIADNPENYNDTFKKYSEQIEKYISLMPKYKDGTVYRGIQVGSFGEPKDIKKFAFLKPGDEIDMRGTSSWSSKEDESHVKRRNIKFVLEKPLTGVSVNLVSEFPAEDEVTFSKDSRFYVKKVKLKKDPELSGDYDENSDNYYSFMHVYIYVEEKE